MFAYTCSLIFHNEDEEEAETNTTSFMDNNRLHDDNNNDDNDNEDDCDWDSFWLYKCVSEYVAHIYSQP